MKCVILTACLTGEGSALAIQKMLENYLRFDKDLIEIIPISIVHETHGQFSRHFSRFPGSSSTAVSLIRCTN